jgi:S1-C subfamily serine protease
MSNRQFAILAGVGCLVLVLVLVAAIVVVSFLPGAIRRVGTAPTAVPTYVVQQPAPVTPFPTLTPGSVAGSSPTAGPGPTVAPSGAPGSAPTDLTGLYHQTDPGVVSVEVFVGSGQTAGQVAGSGFILDSQGHIVTNNHVVAQAQEVLVTFYDGTQVSAKIVGTDPYSDLAVIQVDQLVDGAHTLTLGDSDQVEPGQWVVAIGNPFQQAGSMTLGIVSAVSRLIPSGATRFEIPLAIQTDAAINPGNSGGPLMDLAGQVVGVNAQIATGGVQANAGVGFAIPSNVVQLVVPSLIETGSYQWPWLGVEGTSVDLLIQEANHLDSQQGAYIDTVVPDGPAAQAGLQGSSGSTQILGLTVPTGGDVIVEADGQPVADFGDLLVTVAFKKPGDSLALVVVRSGQQQQITATLSPRPASLGQ